MLKSFWTSLSDELGKRASLYLIVALGSGAVGGVYWFDPFYHSGWLLSYKGWLFLFVVICAIAILVSQSTVGLTLVAVFALLSSGTFAFLYRNPDFQYNEWPFWSWLLHLLCVALIVGVLVGTGARVLGAEKVNQPEARNRVAGKRGRTAKETPPAITGGKGKPGDGDSSV